MITKTEKDWTLAPIPVEEDSHYIAFVEYLEKKNSPKATKLLNKLKTLKTDEDFWYFKDYLLYELFIEVFQNLE